MLASITSGAWAKSSAKCASASIRACATAVIGVLAALARRILVTLTVRTSTSSTSFIQKKFTNRLIDQFISRIAMRTLLKKRRCQATLLPMCNRRCLSWHPLLNWIKNRIRASCSGGTTRLQAWEWFNFQDRWHHQTRSKTQTTWRHPDWKPDTGGGRQAQGAHRLGGIGGSWRNRREESVEKKKYSEAVEFWLFWSSCLQISVNECFNL